MADLPTSITLTVVSRDRKLVEAQVDEVVLPGVDGELGVLPGHTPMLASLKIGPLRYRTGATVERLVISWGFAEVLPDRVIVLAERGVLPGEIDPAAAEEAKREAEREIALLSSNDPEFREAEARLEESIALISVHRDH
jgi:F-type H+-transporting ATPase subunit epsilon